MSDSAASNAAQAHRRNILTSQMIPEEAPRPDLSSPGELARAATSSEALLATARVVAAIDMDCFYAQCEELRHPELRGQPVGVQQKMLVITSNYAAREFGIQKGDSLRVVRQKCPQITICNGDLRDIVSSNGGGGWVVAGEDLTFYGEVSQRVFDVASRWTSKVEKLGLDEIFVDISEIVEERLSALQRNAASGASIVAVGVEYPDAAPSVCPNRKDSDCCREWPRLDDQSRCWIRLAIGSMLCDEIRQAIFTEVGLTSSAGISVSKMLAKLVASWKKPAQQTIFWPTAERLGQLLPNLLAIQKIPGIGFSSTQRCNELGIKTIGELIMATDDTGRPAFRELLTKFDEGMVMTMRAFCLGIDDSVVRTSGPPKSCSVEDSFWQKPLRSDQQVTESLQALARKLLLKIRSDEKRFGFRNIPTMSVSLRHAPAAEDQAASRRERRQLTLDGKLRLASPAQEQPGNHTSEEVKIKQITELAFSLFRKMVPGEPFALNILNLQVSFAEAPPASQRRLCFASGPRREQAGADVATLCVSDDSEDEKSLSAQPAVSATLLDVGTAVAPQDEATPQDDSKTSTLVAMGFTAPEATAALQASGGEVQAAVELLLAGERSTPRSGQADIRSFGGGGGDAVRKRQRVEKVPGSNEDGTVLID